MRSPEEMEALRRDIMSGMDQVHAAADAVKLDVCPHCCAGAEFRYILQKPYAACTNSECGATTGLADTPAEAAEKWNRRYE